MTSDLRYTLRSLLRARWFTVAAVFTFALGIGVNVAAFTSVDRILLRPPPYHNVEELVVLRSCNEKGECRGGFPSLVAFEGQARLTTIGEMGVAGMASSYSVSASPGEVPLVRLSGVSVNLLRVLGVQPVLERDFTDEDAKERRLVALLSHESWPRRFGGSPDVIMTSIGSAARLVSIVGVDHRNSYRRGPRFIDPDGTARSSTATGRMAAIGKDGIRVAARATGARNDGCGRPARRSRPWCRRSHRSSRTVVDGCRSIRVDTVHATALRPLQRQRLVDPCSARGPPPLACANLQIFCSRADDRANTMPPSTRHGVPVEVA